MRNLEKIELLTIIAVALLIAYFGHYLPSTVNFGQLIVHVSVILLVQGLIRDVMIVMLNRNIKHSETEKHQAIQCMCLESSFGVLGIIIGGFLLLSGFDFSLSMNNKIWSLVFIAVTAFGFLIKDYIFVWNPFAIRKEKDHLNILFSWKK